MGNCFTGVYADKGREANQQAYKTVSQGKTKIPQPAETQVSFDIPACDDEIPDSYLLDTEGPYNTFQEGGTDLMKLSKSQEQCITKDIPLMTSESIGQDIVLSNNVLDCALKYHNCQNCTLLQERIQILLKKIRSLEEKTCFNDHVTCNSKHDSLICGTPNLLPLHENTPSTSTDTRFEKRAHFHQSSQDENSEAHVSLEDKESDSYQVQEGPGTNWQFGHHYFNATYEDEASKDDDANTVELFPDAREWKIPISKFLGIGGKGITVDAAGCELILGPQPEFSIFGNRIL